jgi:hypothetical protein
MKVSDIRYGKQTFVEIKPSSQDDFGELSALTEIEVFSTELESESLLRVGEKAWSIEGINSKNQELLNGLLRRALPRISWIIARYPKQSNVLATKLTLELREYPSDNIWPEPVEIGIDEKILDFRRKKRRSLVSMTEVIDWISEKAIVFDSSGSTRILISSSPNAQADQRSAFRIYGKGYGIDVARDSEDKLLVTRIVEAKSNVEIDERRPILFVRGQFKFVDYTIAGSFRGTARSELDQIVSESSSYLGIWNEYNKLESQNLLNRARDFGWFDFHLREQLSDGSWRFSLNKNDQLEQKIRSLKETETASLEAAEQVPPSLIEYGDSTEKKRQRIFSGDLIAHDVKHSTLDIRPPAGSEDQIYPPPEFGVIFLSLSGDQVRLKRRKEAQAKIASADCPMPQLGLIIEGKVVPQRRRKKYKALSAAANEMFGGLPTDRQKEALVVALNTPDIALIQGPPGTGKTRTIAALQTRLSEISEDTEDVSARYLLSSYQHDAVENVANATQVFGLPAIKIGHKRGEDLDEGFDRWRLDRIEAVRSRLAMSSEIPAAVALRKCRDLTVGYLKAPSKADNVIRLLTDISDLASLNLPPEINDQILELKQDLKSKMYSNSADDFENELVIKAIRGLRCTDAAFSDDGDTQAYKVFSRLKKLKILTSDDEVLLEKASTWDTDLKPDFLSELSELQIRLIDQLTPDERPVDFPIVNTDVEAVLNLVLEALREKVRSSFGGVEAVLNDYCNDLENDRDGTRQAIESYTVVLAATCQQAVGYQMNQLKNSDNIFDTVVVDEAARANPLDLLIPMSLAERRIILVGDHRQLPHILDHQIEEDLHTDVQEKTREMLHTSLFKRLFEQLQARERVDGIKRTVTLNKQYRMHPILGQFVSKTFYEPYGESFESDDEKRFEHDLEKYSGAVAAWVDLPLGKGSERSGQSKSRPIEAKWIAKEAYKVMSEHPDLSVGIISFYSAQTTEILKQMEPLGITEFLDNGGIRINASWLTTRDKFGDLIERIRIGTVDAFQGKEFDIVFLSMTRSNDIVIENSKLLRRKFGHLMLENRLCVSMSRQKRLLIVVGDSLMLRGEEAKKNLRGLVEFKKLCEGKNGIQFRL